MRVKSKRKLWQIHLSTAVAMTIVTGGLIGVNVRPTSASISCAMNAMNLLSTDGSGGIGEFRRYQYFGWPLVWLESVDNVRSSGGAWVASDDVKPQLYLPRQSRLPLLFNVLILAAMILSMGIVLEWLIRRREARKT
jgi:hypothetical protein